MFTWKSTKFAEELKRRKQQFESSGKLVGIIHVPPEMIWWYWVEFGTAYYAEHGTSNPSGYYIPSPENIDAKVLFFEYNGKEYHIKQIFTLGIPPHHMVTSIEGDIRTFIKASIIKVILQSNYNLEIVKTLMLDSIMPEIKNMIKASFEINLSSVDRPRGKLGPTPADEFENKATITVEAK